MSIITQRFLEKVFTIDFSQTIIRLDETESGTRSDGGTGGFVWGGLS